jgi:3-hydroxyacyl-CoA dehydrogenase/enoyl-CoA hydratase/3-hydroxybutyryl-CoA epimerase
MSDTSHWQQQLDTDGICWLTLDRQDANTNSLSAAVLQQLGAVLDELEGDNSIRGLVVQSAKSSFVVGADIGEFEQFEDAAEAFTAVRLAQQIFDRLETLTIPSVALINGHALGGGLELAMACRYRVAAQTNRKTLGLPEVQLGVHPGFGGTVRAVALVGPIAALDLMLTGRTIRPGRAQRIGLLDAVVPAAQLPAQAKELIATQPTAARAAWHLRLLTLPGLRHLLARQVRKQVRRRAKPAHYPAPYSILDLFTRYGGRGDDAMVAEAKSIAGLLMTSTSRNLVRVFFLRDRLKHLATGASAAAHVHVVGAGLMGGDIAAWSAAQGLVVTLQDRAAEYVERALKRAAKLFARRFKGNDQAAARQRLTMDLDASMVGEADVVIEAIYEDLEAKQALFQGLEDQLKPNAILATNTSSIRLELIASALHDPSRLVGIHFFNPVAKLPLVEVIRSDQTDPAVFQRAVEFVVALDKLPLPCRSAPGFLVNRILAPYMLEAMQAHEEGLDLETIDAAAEAFGMPVGPVELADRVGLDVAQHVAVILGEALGRPVPTGLAEMVTAGQLGAKSGHGFYRYENNRAQKQARFGAAPDDLQDRLILPMVNEAVACYAEKVVEELDFIDAGVIFGTGFAPFTGGPIQYARQRGFTTVHNRLIELAAQHGTRFTPHSGWQHLLEDLR